MKRDFNTILKDWHGQPLLQDGDEKKDATGAPPKPLALGFVCLGALGQQLDTDMHAGAERLKHYALAQRIVEGMRAKKPVEVTPEEISALKERILKCFVLVVSGACCALLDADFTE